MLTQIASSPQRNWLSQQGIIQPAVQFFAFSESPTPVRPPEYEGHQMLTVRSLLFHQATYTCQQPRPPGNQADDPFDTHNLRNLSFSFMWLLLNGVYHIVQYLSSVFEVFLKPYQIIPILKHYRADNTPSAKQVTEQLAYVPRLSTASGQRHQCRREDLLPRLFSHAII